MDVEISIFPAAFFFSFQAKVNEKLISFAAKGEAPAATFLKQHSSGWSCPPCSAPWRGWLCLSSHHLVLTVWFLLLRFSRKKYRGVQSRFPGQFVV